MRSTFSILPYINRSKVKADGTTAVLQGLHRTWAPITDFSHALAAELGHPVQANAYGVTTMPVAQVTV